VQLPEVQTAHNTVARLILASANPYSTPENPVPAIGTLLLTYPRFIHSELMTYREWSRNAASSRAIPIETVIAQVRENPAIPVYFTGRKKGMGGDETSEIVSSPSFQQARREAWIKQANLAADYAEREAKQGASKQEINRALEPYMWMQTIVTATAWRNMLRQRLSPAAQPDFRMLALAIGILLAREPLRPIDKDEWHLPYIDGLDDGSDWRDGSWFETRRLSIEDRLGVSAGRLGRVTFYQRGVVDDVPADLARGRAHKTNGHWSPWEHAAKPLPVAEKQGGNLTGWLQARRYIAPETEAGNGPYNPAEDCELIGDVIKNGW
jgi:hypothetical protein